MNRMGKRTDKYIQRCFREKKISINPWTGDVYSCNMRKKYKQSVKESGYCFLNFKFFNERRSVLVHRIIYIGVHGSIPEHYHIDHIDRNPLNNSISNLRAVTASENMYNRNPKSRRGR